MKQLSNIYAQLDNIVSTYMESNLLDQLDDEFKNEYFSLREEIIAELSSLMTSQYNYDESISKNEKEEIAQLITMNYEIIENFQQYPIDPLFSIQGKIESILINKYMHINGYERDNNGLWQIK